MGKSQRFRAADVAKLMDAVAEFHEPRPMAEAVPAMVRTLRRLVVTNSAGFCVAAPPGSEQVIESLHYDNFKAHVKHQELMHEDPAIPFVCERNSSFETFRTKDILDWCGDRRPAIWTEVYQPAGASFGLAMSCALGRERFLLGGLHRDVEFRQNEEAVFRLAAVHAVRALRAKQAQANAENGLRGALPMFVFDHEGRSIFLNEAGRRFAEGGEPNPGAEPSLPQAVATVRPPANALQELRTLAALLFNHRQTGTLHEVPNPIVWDGFWRVDFAFEHPDGNGEPQAIALMVRSPAPLPGAAWWLAAQPVSASTATFTTVLEGVGVTKSELEVAKLLWQGKLEKEVARAIHRSLPTVKFHVGNLYRRCGVSRRPEWMAWVSAKLDISR